MNNSPLSENTKKNQVGGKQRMGIALPNSPPPSPQGVAFRQVGRHSGKQPTPYLARLANVGEATPGPRSHLHRFYSIWTPSLDGGGVTGLAGPTPSPSQKNKTPPKSLGLLAVVCIKQRFWSTASAFPFVDSAKGRTGCTRATPCTARHPSG